MDADRKPKKQIFVVESIDDSELQTLTDWVPACSEAVAKAEVKALRDDYAGIVNVCTLREYRDDLRKLLTRVERALTAEGLEREQQIWDKRLRCDGTLIRQEDGKLLGTRVRDEGGFEEYVAVDPEHPPVDED